MANDPNLYRDDNGTAGQAGDLQKSKEPGNKPAPDGRRAKYWREIERYQRAVSDWHQEGDEIEQIYLDRNRVQGSSARKYSMLWANVEVLKPSVYAKLPKVICERRHKDKDKAARTAAELLERASNVTLEIYNVHETFRLVRDDRLLPGRGQAWVRYDATIEQFEMDEGQTDDTDDDDEDSEDSADAGSESGEPQIGERLKSERACVDYVHWKDFGHNIARTWNEVWLVWRIVFKTREEVAERFGADKASRLAYNAKLPSFGSGGTQDDPDQRAKIYELWDKRGNITAWIADGYDQFLEIGPPPVNFENGFPCPEPVYGTKTSRELIPRPDYTFYRDQAREINDLTDKIHNMSQYLIIKGYYPGAPSSTSDPLTESLRDKGNREMFQQIDSMTEWNEAGGINKLIDWFPTEKVQQAIEGAISMRNQLVQDVYQITGIADIMRSQTNPNETLGAQELKMQTGTNRLRNTRDDIARFTRDVSRLVCEVIAEQFAPETIAEMTGYKYIPGPMMLPGGAQLFGPGQPLPLTQGLPNPGPAIGQSFGQPSPPPIGAPVPVSHPIGMIPPRFGLPNLPAPSPMQMQGGQPQDDMTFSDDVMEILRNDRMRGFRVEIETDSTVLADEQAEKQARMEFLGAVTPYMQQAVQAIQMAPALAPTMGELLMFAVRAFHVGSGLEETIEKGFAAIAQQAMEAKQAPPQPDPTKLAEIQSNEKIEGGKLQTHAQIEAAKIQSENQRHVVDAQVASGEQQSKNMLEVRKQNLDFESEQRDRHHDAHAQVQDRHARMLAALQRPGKMQ